MNKNLFIINRFNTLKYKLSNFFKINLIQNTIIPEKKLI